MMNQELSRLARLVALGLTIACLLAVSGCDGSKPDENAAAPAALAPAQAAPATDGAVRTLFELPDFELVDQSGSPYGSANLDGRVWIADFIFTRCQTTCPLITTQMAQLQTSLRSLPGGDDVRLVSFSVDPEHDTPPVLSAYAKKYGADPRRWRFLTGSRDQIWQLSKDGFKLPVGDDAGNVDMPIFHSLNLVLVDRAGRVRGVYDSTSEDDRDKLKRDVEAVAGEAPSASSVSAGGARQVAFPPDALDPPWLEPRRRAQLATAGSFDVFNGFRFVDRAPTSGITFEHEATDDSGVAYQANHYDHGNGILAGDVDGDGKEDLFFLTQLGSNELWKSNGDGTFRRLPAPALELADKVSVSGAFGDVDNDGDLDVYVTTVRQGNHMFENDGRGGFTDITAASGLEFTAHSSAAVFFDYDRDGLLDLFVCNVGVYTKEERGRGGYFIGLGDAFAGHLKPDERNEPSVLYRNQGGNRFTDVTKATGLVDESWNGEATPLDVNEDGFIDLYLANMQGNDEYYENVAGQSVS